MGDKQVSALLNGASAIIKKVASYLGISKDDTAKLDQAKLDEANANGDKAKIDTQGIQKARERNQQATNNTNQTSNKTYNNNAQTTINITNTNASPDEIAQAVQKANDYPLGD